MPILMILAMVLGLMLPAELDSGEWGDATVFDGTITVGAGSGGSGSASGSAGHSGGSGAASGGPVFEPLDPSDNKGASGMLLGFMLCDSTDGVARICATPSVSDPTPTPTPVTASMVEGWARSATTSLHLPASMPVIGPDPSANEWGMLAVGLPVWLWTSEPRTLDASVTASGIALTLQAHRGETTFDLGDGTVVVCEASTVRPDSADPMEPSPTCGHTYSTAGTYAVTATTRWAVSWAALGFSGSFDVPRTSTATLEVGELVSVVVR